MKKVLKYFSFLLFSVIQVRVKASSGMITKPVGCKLYDQSKQKSNCLLSSGQEVVNLEADTVKINLNQKSMIESFPAPGSDFRFLGGTAWIKTPKLLVWQTLYGKVEKGSGEFWMIEEGKKIWIRNIIGELNLQVQNQKVDVPEGFQIWIAGLSSRGEANYGVPELIPMEDHIKLWRKLDLNSSREEFIELVKRLKNLYQNNVELSSELYQKIADRHVASVREQKRREEQRQLQLKRENERRRELYYEKVFGR